MDTELQQALQALEEAWLRGEATAVPLPGAAQGQDRLARLIADLLAAQDLALALSKGDLSPALQAKGVTAGSLKALQSALRHLVWQMSAVAQGDLSQRVDWMGEFSESFNAMVDKLAAARDQLQQQEQKLVQANDQLRAEVVERQLSEARLQALYELAQQSLQTEQELIDYALEEAIRLTGSEIGYFHFVQDQAHLKLSTWSKRALASCTAPTDQHYPLSLAGVWADCARLKRPVVHNDYQALPDKRGYPAGHSHILRHASVPVIDNDLVVAISGVANKLTPYDEADLLQLQLFMDGVWKILVRKRAEAALREKTEELDRFFSVALDLLCIADTDGYFRRVNPAWERELGYRPQDLEGQRFLDFVHPDDLAATLDAVRQLAAGQTVSNFVNRYRCKDDAWRWLDWRSAPYGNHLIFAAARDITRRTEMETALRSSEERYRQLADNAPLPVVVSTLNDGAILYANQRAADLFGIALAELTGRRTLAFYADPQQREVLVQRLCQEGRVTDFEMRLHSANRHELWVLISANLTTFEGRTAIFSTLVDMTLRRYIQQAEREQRALAEALRDSIAAINSTLDMDQVLDRILANVGRVVPHDAADVMLLDRADDAARVVRCVGYDRFSPDVQDSLLALRLPLSAAANLRQVLETRQPQITNDVWNSTGWIKTPETQWIRANLAAPIQARSNVLGFLSLNSATPHFFTPAHAERLRMFADQAALALENARLFEEARATREHAEAANRAKSAFLANMSHELRTPLNAILGFSDLMARDPQLSVEHKENLAIINRSGDHLLDLINDVLDMAKIESGRMALQEHTFDLHRTIDNLVEMFRLRATDKGLQLIVAREPDVPHFISADENKLRQVLINLLSNAVKFTAEGGVGLRVRRLPENVLDTPGVCHLHFEIQDTGPGIPLHSLERIFEPFFQVTEDKSREGTGLGLSICRQFVRLMGGELAAESEGQPGLGALFKFAIPARLALAQEPPSAEPRRPRAIRLEPGRPAYRLLIAEDREESRLLLVRLLTRLGFSVRTATNGLQAIQVWEEWQPHLIWMDMRMPIMDGHEATRRIRAASAQQETIIIALTASAFEDERELVLSEGCNDFVRKPFREDDIVDKLTQHLHAQFVYEGAVESAPVVHIHPPHLAALSAEQMDALQQTALEADADRLKSMADQVRESHPALAAALHEIANNFDYDPLLEAIRSLRGAGKT